MSAASRLWVRAPLWRTALFATIFFTIVALFYPAAWLLRVVPRLQTVTHYIDHMLGRDAPAAPAADGDDSGGSGAAAPGPGGGPGAQSGGVPATSSAPPIDTDLHDIVPFAGRQLPLPAGTWHPVLSTQIGAHGEILSNVFVRTDRGVVTGVVIASASTAAIPKDQSGPLQPTCHDDAAYMNRLTTPAPGVTDCLSTGPMMLGPNVTVPAPDLNLAFERLRVLGFPMPTVMVVATWAHIVRGKDGSVNLQAVATAISPAERGETKLSTILADWSKQGIGLSPFAGRFVKQVNDWIVAWSPTLLNGYNGKLQPSDDPRPGSKDPGYHEG
ncbi:hypothetical protein AA23498_2471 [Acetobacter nitrogenifigens DSM 23921 = NBRC 105050]|uniref:Uncharacterized protein n=1 Tax=Acetobacter nitrogenifigens DSM 23921 = NBRC 105050 TaxID=1120919 RepID=A0A511X7Q2_9PROT|nr:hypothetical protein [Acetobacter nitrogenifigens]GBQ95879.1 hypothetical protein AA23498_2471 [Acetobacter nitrogenifigens DSM 23921 = NBRC 105050]GEN58977.1 hypothetical protein ANI02nite_08610 [Acetobacter nitrogenifigens DSM 23921 = NBRC 105050]